MGRKDIVDKPYFSDCERFAELMNVSLYHGERVLRPENLHDYDFPLIEADYVNPEEYRTDLKEFFQAMQCRKDRGKLRRLFQTEAFQCLSPETERIIARHLHIERLIHKMEKEELPMCKAFDDLMKEERQEGKREGKREEKIRIIKQMIKEGLDEPDKRLQNAG